MNRKELKARLLEQMQCAASTVSFIKNEKTASEEQILDAVHRYICSKLLLEETESKDESLKQLSKKSLERALQMNIALTKDWEKGASCGSAGTIEMKMTLLFMALKRDLDMDIDPVKLGRCRTSREVGRVVFEARK